MTKKNQKENKSLEEEKKEAEQKKVEEEMTQVSKEIQEVLERHNYGLQPFLNFSEGGIVPSVRLVKGNSTDTYSENNEQNSSDK